jgi:hypothetical protein
MADFIAYLSANHDLVVAGTAISALFVSLISIVLAVCSMKMQRTHNRKSVLPIGHISVGDYENLIFVRLENKGVGPLLIKKLSVAKQGDDRQQSGALIDFMPDLPDGICWSTFVVNLPGHVISPGKEISLVLLEGDPDDAKFNDARRLTRNALSVLNIKLEYVDVYEKKMPVVARDLSWFART